MATELKAAADSSRSSPVSGNQHDYRRMLDDSPVYVSSFLPDGTLTYVNALLARTTGKRADELIGLNVFDLLTPEERMKLRQHLYTLSPAHPVGDREQLYSSPDGSLQWQHWTNQAFFNEHGAPVRYQAIGQDITELKQAADRIRHLSSFPELNPNPVMEVNIAGEVTYCNPAALKILEDIGPARADIALLLPDDLSDILARWDGKSESLHHREVLAAQRVFAENIQLIPGIGVARIYASEITKKKRMEQQLKNSIENYRVFATLTSDYVYRCSRTGAAPYRVEWIGGPVGSISGYSAREIHDFGGLLPLVHPDDRQTVSADLLRIVPGEVRILDFRIVTKDGQVRWIADKCCCEKGEGEGELILFGSVRDITERKLMEEALRLTYAELQRHDARMIMLNQMNDLLQTCESHEEAYTVVSTSAGKLFSPYSGTLAIRLGESSEMQVVAFWGDEPGLSSCFLFSDCWALRRGTPHKVSDPANSLGCKLYQGRTEYPHFCMPLLARGQTLGMLQVTATDNQTPQFDEMYNLATTMSESITLALSNLMLREALREQAIRDPLTGLFNRRYLEETLPLELKMRQRNNESLTVVMLDLDLFKTYNDKYGHEAGDIVLREIGALLRNSLRGGDIACRYGGEEFTVILPGSTLEHAMPRLDNLRHKISERIFQNRERTLPAITISMGISEARPGETDAATLLSRADAALYQAKQQGRNRIVTAD